MLSMNEEYLKQLVADAKHLKVASLSNTSGQAQSWMSSSNRQPASQQNMPWKTPQPSAGTVLQAAALASLILGARGDGTLQPASQQSLTAQTAVDAEGQYILYAIMLAMTVTTVALMLLVLYLLSKLYKRTEPTLDTFTISEILSTATGSKRHLFEDCRSLKHTRNLRKEPVCEHCQDQLRKTLTALLKSKLKKD